MIYLLCTLSLVAVMVAFFLWTEGRFRPFGRIQGLLRVLVVLPLLVSGILHFTRTVVFATMVPPIFPHSSLWVVLTGFMELGGAIGLLVPRTTRTASTCITLLMIAVFPANIYAAHRTVGGLHMPGVPVRFAMQVVYILLVLAAGWGMPQRARKR
jgi:uncharacterized membrane protein